MATTPTDRLEEPTGDDEDSPCIGQGTDAPVPIIVQADVESGPEADQVYGSRWQT